MQIPVAAVSKKLNCRSASGQRPGWQGDVETGIRQVSSALGQGESASQYTEREKKERYHRPPVANSSTVLKSTVEESSLFGQQQRNLGQGRERECFGRPEDTAFDEVEDPEDEEEEQRSLVVVGGAIMDSSAIEDGVFSSSVLGSSREKSEAHFDAEPLVVGSENVRGERRLVEDVPSDLCSDIEGFEQTSNEVYVHEDNDVVVSEDNESVKGDDNLADGKVSSSATGQVKPRATENEIIQEGLRQGVSGQTTKIVQLKLTETKKGVVETEIGEEEEDEGEEGEIDNSSPISSYPSEAREFCGLYGAVGEVYGTFQRSSVEGVHSRLLPNQSLDYFQTSIPLAYRVGGSLPASANSSPSARTGLMGFARLSPRPNLRQHPGLSFTLPEDVSGTPCLLGGDFVGVGYATAPLAGKEAHLRIGTAQGSQSRRGLEGSSSGLPQASLYNENGPFPRPPAVLSRVLSKGGVVVPPPPPPPLSGTTTLNLSPPLGFVREESSGSPKRLGQSSFMGMSETACGLSSGFPPGSGPADSVHRRSSPSGVGHSSCLHRITVTLLWPSLEPSAFLKTLQLPVLPYAVQTYRTAHSRRALRIDFCTMAEAVVALRRLDGLAMSYEKDGLNGMSLPFVVSSVTEVPITTPASAPLATAGPLPSGSPPHADTTLKWKEGILHAGVKREGSDLTLHTPQLKRISGSQDVSDSPGKMDYRAAKVLPRAGDTYKPVRVSPNTPVFSKSYAADLRGSLDNEFYRGGRKQSQSSSLIGNRSPAEPVSFWCEHASFQTQLDDYRRLVSRFGLTNRYICLHRVPDSLSDFKVLKEFLDDALMSRDEYEMEVILAPEPLSACAEPEVTVVPSEIPQSTVVMENEDNSIAHVADISLNALKERATTLEKDSGIENKLRNGDIGGEKKKEFDQHEICNDNPVLMDRPEECENKQRSNLQATAGEGDEDVSMEPCANLDDGTVRDVASCTKESSVPVRDVEHANPDDTVVSFPTGDVPLIAEGQRSRGSDAERNVIGNETVAFSSIAGGDSSTGESVAGLDMMKTMVKTEVASSSTDAALSGQASLEEGPVKPLSDDITSPESEQTIQSGCVRRAHLAFKTKKAAQLAFRKLQKAWHNAASVELTGPRRPNFTLWIGNLRAETMGREALESQLLVLLKRYGRLKRLRLFPERSCAFATFETLEGARAARNHLHGFLFGKQMHSILLNVDFLAATGGTPGKGGSATGRLTVEEKTHEIANARRFYKICEFCAQRHKENVHQADLDGSQSEESSSCRDAGLENVGSEQRSDSIAVITLSTTDGASACATKDNPSEGGENTVEGGVCRRASLPREAVPSASEMSEGRLEHQQRFSSGYDNSLSLCDSWETGRSSHGRDLREKTLSGDARHWGGSGFSREAKPERSTFSRIGDGQQPVAGSGRSPARRGFADCATRGTEDVGFEKCIEEPRDRRRLSDGGDSSDYYRNNSKSEMSRDAAYGAERHRYFRNETGRYSSQPKQQEQRHHHFSRQQQQQQVWVQRRERSPGYRRQSGINPDARFSPTESRAAIIEEPHFQPQETQQQDRQEEKQRRFGRTLVTSSKCRRSPSVVPPLRKSPGVMTPPKRKRRNDSPSRLISYREGRSFLLSGGNGARRIPQDKGSPSPSTPFVNNQQHQPSWRKRREHMPSRIRVEQNRHHPVSGIASSAYQQSSPSRQQHHRPLPHEITRSWPDDGKEIIAGSGLPTAQGRNGVTSYSSHYRRRHRRSCSSSWSSSSSAGDNGRHRSDHKARSCSSNMAVVLPETVVNQGSGEKTEDTGSNATVIKIQAESSPNRGSVSGCVVSGCSQRANSESGDANIPTRLCDDGENISSGDQKKEDPLKKKIASPSPAATDLFRSSTERVPEHVEHTSGSANVLVVKKGLHVEEQASTEQAHRPSTSGDVCQLCKQGQRLCRLRFEFERGDSSIELPLTLDVSTRSTPEKLQSMLSRRSEKYGVWRLLPDTEDEKPAYISFCGYFQQRQRIGLLEATNATLFIVPLEPATSSEFHLVTSEVTLFAFVFPRRTKTTSLHS